MKQLYYDDNGADNAKLVFVADTPIIILELV